MYLNNALTIISNFGMTPWLGEFDVLSLSKAPLFPIFLASIHTLGLPLRLAEFLLFAPLPFLFWFAIRLICADKWIVLFTATLCLLFIPIAGFESRLLRGTLFGLIALYCLIFISGTIIRIYLNKRSVCLWSLGVGLTLGLAITCREDAFWLMLPAALALIIQPIICWHRVNIPYIAFALFFAAVAYMIPVTTISVLNETSYGMYSPSLRQSHEFQKLYSTLCSLEPNTRQRFIPIAAETRQKTYKISPHFKELSTILEGPAMDNIAKSSAHLRLNGYDLNEREFFVSNFEFALARAIALAGHNTGRSFLNFCTNVTDEIDKAVANSLIDSGLKGISLLPPVEFTDIPNILGAGFKAFITIHKGLNVDRPLLDSGKYTAETLSERTYWHSVLKTWPRQSKNDHPSIKLSDRLFNQLSSAYSVAYPLFLTLGIIFALYLLFRSDFLGIPISIIALISWSALLGYCLSLGLVNTIAFPVVQGFNTYTGMGFYPLQYLLLISLLTILLTFRNSGNPAEHQSS